MSRTFLKFFAAEVFVVLVVVSLFSLIESRLVAGAIAGTLFSFLGFYIFLTGLRQPLVLKSLTFVFTCIHLFLITLPMMITRFLNTASEFGEVLIWGMPGPLFHRFSTVLYMLLVFATLFDWYRFYRQERKNPQP